MLDSTIRNKIAGLHAGNRPKSLVNAVGYILFSAMRIDPANPYWQGADHIVYSEQFSDLMADAFRSLGVQPNSVPAPGVHQLISILDNNSNHRAIFCLLTASDAERFPHVKQELPGNLVVISSDAPLNSSPWQVEPVELTLEDWNLLQSLRSRTQPLWIVAPIAEPPVRTECFHKTSASGDRMKRLGTETALTCSPVHALRAQGQDILSFGLGEPDFDTPGHIKDTANGRWIRMKPLCSQCRDSQIRQAIAVYTTNRHVL